MKWGGWQSAHDRLEAEQALLAALVTRSGAVARVRGIVRPEDFRPGRGRRLIYRACLHVADRGRRVDATEVAVLLLDHGRAMAELYVDILATPAVPMTHLTVLARRIASGREARGYVTAAEIARVRAATDLVALVRERVPTLKRRGHWYVSACPFHEESPGGAKAHTFSVCAATGLYHCFRCKVSGDAFAFVEHFTPRSRRSFREAVRVLANREGVVLRLSRSRGRGRR